MTDSSGGRDYQDTIANLLALAEHAGTGEAEAEAAAAMAERMMIKYNITQLQISAKRLGKARVEEPIITDSITYKGSYTKAYEYFSFYIIRALGNIETYHTKMSSSVTRVYLVGYESDVAQAKELLTSLQLQANSALARWWPTFTCDNPNLSKGMQSFKARRSFLIKFGEGAGERIKLSRETIIGEAESSEPGTAVMIRDRGQNVLDHFNTLGLNLSYNGRGIEHGAAAARNAGMNAGLNSNTGDSQVGRGRQTAIGK